MTPGIFVDRVVCTTTHFDPAVLRQILMAVGRTTEQTGRAVREGGPSGLPPDLMAMKVAALLRDGEYVNLGIGLPTMVSNFLAGRDVILHAENGMLGYGGFPPEGEEDIDLYNASGQLVTALPGSAYFDSTVSFAHGAHGPRLFRRARRLPGGGQRRPGQLEHPGPDRRRHRRRHGSGRRRRAPDRRRATSSNATAARSWSNVSPTRRPRSAASGASSPTSPGSTSMPTASCCASWPRA